MDTKQPLTLFVVAILAASVFSVVGITSMPLQNASAQDVTIETSADDHEGTFFTGMLQVIIEDETTDDDDDSIQVDVTVEEDGGASDSGSLTILDTSNGSQRFEFFLVHQDGADQSPADPEAGAVQVFDFGDGAAEFPVAGFELFDSGSIEIDYGDEPTITIDYDESSGELTIDRDAPYGSTSLVHLMIYDNDGNLDPTDSGAFTATDSELDDAVDRLFDATGADFVDDVTFDETGDNTAIFEAILQLNTTDSSTDDELDFSSDTITLELFDKAIYTDIDNGNNTSTDTSEVSFEVEDADGDMDTITSLTFGGEIPVTVRDDDQNIDSDNDDTITDGLSIEVLTAGGDSVTVDLAETGDNTGVFMPDLANDEVRITFLEDGATIDTTDDILQLRAEDIDEDILIEYDDPLSDDGTPDTVASFTVEIDLTPGVLSAPETVGVNDEFTLTLTDVDLNDNPRTRDSYEILLTGASPFNLTRGGDDFAEIYTFEMDLAGEDLDFDTEDVSVTLTETGINTGIFEGDIDMEDIGNFGDEGGTLAISDGDDLDITINDFMADVDDADEDDVSITIGKPSVGLDFSRTSVPIPPVSGGSTAAEVGTATIFTLILTDPQLDNNESVEEAVDFDFGTAANNFTIEVEGEAVVDSAADFFGDANCDDGGAGAAGGAEAEIVGGVSLCTVMGIEDATDLADVLEETGDNTGVFEWELEFTDNADISLNDWDDLELTFEYTDDEGDEETAGFTFRGNDAVATVDQPQVKAGTIVTITVEDQDLNLDDAEVDQFESGTDLLMIETEDEEIADLPDTETFEETGEDTGVFSAEFEIGADIPISQLVDDEVEQATNILITYDDEIDSTGSAGDEIELNVPVVSSTGSLQVTPELVGPATELTILIIDADLDEDADAVDDYIAPADAVNSDDFFISFSSDRNEVGDGSPDIEETGANTGVFMFTLQLETDETQCQDDELEDEFAAEGGDTDSTIGACPGDLISIRYEDEMTGGGGSGTVSEVVEVQSFDPEFAADKDSYSISDRVTISISDPDANRDADIADSLTDIRVRSDSDQVGEELSALETGEDTGVFRLSFGTTSGTQGGAISVKQGDDVTITYTDEFPADFEEQEEDKDFQFTVSIGGSGDVGSTTVTPPVPTDVTGKELDEVSSGQQVVLTTNVINNNAAPQPFVALLEVRDNNGVTIFLAWQTGTLPANDRTQVGLSWTPEDPGDYQVRTFVISDLTNPRVLSLVSTSDITVN
jgi:hypothetical protein